MSHFHFYTHISNSVIGCLVVVDKDQLALTCSFMIMY